MIEYGVALTAGLLSGLHCSGMCGPLVIGYSAQPIGIEGIEGYGDKSTGGVRLRRGSLIMPHVAYNAGRTASYSMLGAMAGLVGTAIAIGAGVRPWVTLVLGAAMVLAGAWQLLGRKVALTSSAGRLGRFFQDALHGSNYESRFLLGLITPLLPCGLLYAMVLEAAATQSPFKGAGVMASFALGTAPALFAVGALTSFFSREVRHLTTIRLWGSRLAAVVIIAMGIATFSRGLNAVNAPAADCCHPASATIVHNLDHSRP